MSQASDSNYDDSYKAVFDQNAAHIRSAGLDALRQEPDAVAALVDVPDHSAGLAQAVRQYLDVTAAREALAEMAADPQRRVYLVLRPDEDLSRPGRPDVDVEWIDQDDQRRSGRILA